MQPRPALEKNKEANHQKPHHQATCTLKYVKGHLGKLTMEHLMIFIFITLQINQTVIKK